MQEDGKTLPELQAEHPAAPRSRLAKPPGEETEQAPYRNYVRDLILGVNDGIVSVYALVAGLVGLQFGGRQVLVAGIAAAVAGALSMGLGEYISTKSQAQYYRSEARREREHVRAYPELEREELRQMLTERDYPPAMVPALVDHIASSEDRFVEFMMREEFGVGKESDRSPVAAMALIMAAFLAGAAMPLVAFATVETAATALLWATGLALVALFAAGAAKGKAAGIPWLRSGAEMVALGGVAGLLTYGVGRLIPGAG